MFAVIFEVEPKPERRNEYLALGRALGPKVEASEGFIDIDRFASRRAEGRLLSLSTWRNEKAVVRWRTHAAHHSVQDQGRREIFLDYRLRVGEVTADSEAREPLAQERFDTTEVGSAKFVTVTDLVAPENSATGEADGLASELGLDPGRAVAHELFESIYTPGKLILLVSWREAEAANAWKPRASASLRPLRHRQVRIIRDYGLFDRREAPQYYPDPARRERGTTQPATSEIGG